MQYLSIIRFFEYSGIAYDDPGTFHLSRAKKLIAAEFAMQADGIIVVDNYSYTRQDVLSELERPDFLQRLQFHKLVWEHKALLDFLEQETFESDSAASWFSLHELPGFVAFVSPYFAGTYNRVMRSFLNSHDLAAAAEWLDYLCFVDAGAEEEALRNTRIYLNDVVRFFRNLNDTSFKSRDKELRMWYTTSWSTFINKLPDSLLSYVDEIVSAIINFTVRIQKSGKKICYKISKELLKVTNANYSLIQLVRSNHEAYTQNYKSKTFSGWLKSGVNIVYVIMIAVFAISRLFLGDSDDLESRLDTVREQRLNDAQAEVRAYQAARDFFSKNYGRQQRPLPGAIQTVSTLFDPKEVYLLIEGSKDSSKALSPFVVRNNTKDTIHFFMLHSGDVYNFEVAPQQFLSFAPADKGQSMDMFLQLGNTQSTYSLPYNISEDMQALQIAPQGVAHDTAYAFRDTAVIDIPYLEDNEQAAKAALVIEINQRQGLFYFELKGHGNIVFQKSAGRSVTIKKSSF